MWIGLSYLPTPFQEAAIFIERYVMARASVTRGRVEARQAGVQLDPAHRAGPETWDREGCFLPPKDTLTLPHNRKRGSREEEYKKGREERASCKIFIQLSCPVTVERPQLFSHAGFNWWLPSLDTNQSPQSLSPPPPQSSLPSSSS